MITVDIRIFSEFKFKSTIHFSFNTIKHNFNCHKLFVIIFLNKDIIVHTNIYTAFFTEMKFYDSLGNIKLTRLEHFWGVYPIV